MKKIILFFVTIVFSISGFAQDKAVLAEYDKIIDEFLPVNDYLHYTQSKNGEFYNGEFYLSHDIDFVITIHPKLD